MAERRRLRIVPSDPAPQRWIRVEWVGDVDACSVGSLASTLRHAWEQDPDVLEVDLAAVTFLDTSGLRPLVEARARLLDRLRLFAPAPPVTRLLQLLGLTDLFVVVGPVGVRSAGQQVMVEQAKGLLMAVHGCDASSAWDVLRSHALAHDVGVEEMAGLLVAHAPGATPQESRAVMEDVMAERARAPSPAE